MDIGKLIPASEVLEGLDSWSKVSVWAKLDEATWKAVSCALGEEGLDDFATIEELGLWSL